MAYCQLDNISYKKWKKKLLRTKWIVLVLIFFLFYILNSFRFNWIEWQRKLVKIIYFIARPYHPHLSIYPNNNQKTYKYRIINGVNNKGFYFFPLLWKWENYFSFPTIIPTPYPSPSSHLRHSIFTKMPNTVKWFITSSKSNQMRKWERKTEIFIKLYFYSIIFMILELLGWSRKWRIRRRKH